MEEADALCSRIGIMAGGSLRAIGTQLYLKSRFGDGFKVTMTVDAVSRSTQIEALMLSLSADAKLAYTTGKQFTYTVPLASGDVNHPPLAFFLSFPSLVQRVGRSRTKR